jgi:hypothetical protein
MPSTLAASARSPPQLSSVWRIISRSTASSGWPTSQDAISLTVEFGSSAGIPG